MGFLRLHTESKKMDKKLMKKVLITGGSGTVGAAFIDAYYDQYYFYSYSQNEQKQFALKKNFSKVELVIGSIEDKSTLEKVFCEVKPDIVIHAAACKRIDVCEQHPAQAIKTNIIGSMNVIDAARIAHVPVTIGISSDKACLSTSVYGHTKNLMERIFLEADSEKNRFFSCRFGNVAGSVGSVIPLWMQFEKEGKPLQLTNPAMNRFMFSHQEAAELIQKAIDYANQDDQSCVLIKKIKPVNILDLANQISSNTQVIGSKPGEKLDETLVSENELPFTYTDGDYILIKERKNTTESTRLKKELNSAALEKMQKHEIINLIRACENFKGYVFEC